VVQRWSSVLHRFDPSREEEEGEDPCTDKNTVNEIPPDDVPHEEEKCISSRGAETFSVDCIPVQELDTFLQTPEAALHAVIFLNLLTFQLVIQVLQNDPDHLDQRQDERAKRQGARVVSGQQEEAQANREDGEGGNVLGLFEGPVGGHEVGAPEEEEHVVELKQDEVIVVEGLPAVEGKQALGIGALSRNVRDVECLQREKRGVITDFM
uniref:Uncharacterized protein n=1 Tax=Mola mola TaxID=94237 RepID=A0A3Q3W0R0_MOLML